LKNDSFLKFATVWYCLLPVTATVRENHCIINRGLDVKGNKPQNTQKLWDSNLFRRPKFFMCF